jgi:hypothetical protein
LLRSSLDEDSRPEILFIKPCKRFWRDAEAWREEEEEKFVQFETQMSVRGMMEGDFKMEEKIELATKPLLD